MLRMAMVRGVKTRCGFLSLSHGIEYSIHDGNVPYFFCYNVIRREFLVFGDTIL